MDGDRAAFFAVFERHLRAEAGAQTTLDITHVRVAADCLFHSRFHAAEFAR